ncbi:MAG: RDD family protein [Bdellovibrionales bacterium]|nr:RDD family protein [Bdellovibrionales bacterium]
MLCPQCGSEVGESIRLCKPCESNRLQAEAIAEAERSASRALLRALHGEGATPEETTDPLTDQDPGEEAPKVLPFNVVGYGGFWLRLLAFLVDASILALAGRLLLRSGSFPIEAGMERFTRDLAYHASSAGGQMAFMFYDLLLSAIASLMVALFAQFALGLAYYSLFESSRIRATPGKYLLRLRVVDGDAERISLTRAMCRHFAKLLSSVPLGLGFVIAGFTEEKRALHDILAGSFVVRTGALGVVRAFIVLFLLAALWLGNASLPGKNEGLFAFLATSPLAGPSQPGQPVGYQPRTSGLLQVGGAALRLHDAAALYHPQEHLLRFAFFHTALSADSKAALAAQPTVDKLLALQPDLLIEVSFLEGTSTCDVFRANALRVRFLPGGGGLHTKTDFHYAGVMSDQMRLNCRLNDQAVYLADFAYVPQGTRVEVRWDIETSGLILVAK